jgi:hypothetical protein
MSDKISDDTGSNRVPLPVHLKVRKILSCAVRTLSLRTKNAISSVCLLSLERQKPNKQVRCVVDNVHVVLNHKFGASVHLKPSAGTACCNADASPVRQACLAND